MLGIWAFHLTARRGAVRGLVWCFALCIPLSGGGIASDRDALGVPTASDT